MTPDPKGYARDCPIRSLENLQGAKRQERWEWKAKRFKGQRYNALELQLAQGAYYRFEQDSERIMRALFAHSR